MNEVLEINFLKDIIDFSPIQCDSLAEYCAVALDDRGKSQGVTLEITGDTNTRYDLKWKSPQKTKGYKEQREWVKFGAVAISCFLVAKLTEYSVVEESPQGTGVDYFLGYNETNPKFNPINFFHARLEVSGIRVETKTNTVNGRVKKKLAQTSPTDSTALPAYVSIVEFNSPKAHFCKKI